MKIDLDKTSHWLQPLLTLALVALMTVLLARHPLHIDMTANGRHSLMEETQALLSLFQSPVNAEVFIAPHDAQAKSLKILLQRYRTASPFFEFRFTDPALDPARTRKLQIAAGGELILRHSTRQQRLANVSQTSITMALRRLLREDTHQLLFAIGHDERRINGTSGADIAHFANHLKQTGYQIGTINLADEPLNRFHHNDSDRSDTPTTLIIAGPLKRYLPTETAQILDFVSHGGNLLWLTEPHSDDGLRALEIELGVVRQAGVVVDLAAQQLQVQRPDFALGHQYSTDQVTNGFESTTLFPQATALETRDTAGWAQTALVITGEKAWTETGTLTGEVKFGDDAREKSGPLTLALALQRNRNQHPQRVVVVGDGDFLADAWIGNGGNRDLATRLINWLSADEHLLTAQVPRPADSHLEISNRGILLLTLTTLLLLPGSLLGSSAIVWFRRRHA